MLKRFLVGLTLILVIFAFFPMDVIDFLGKFALGWMIMDLVSYFITED
jgi:hypothetical protein